MNVFIYTHKSIRIVKRRENALNAIIARYHLLQPWFSPGLQKQKMEAALLDGPSASQNTRRKNIGTWGQKEEEFLTACLVAKNEIF